jgi:hypothetical protein
VRGARTIAILHRPTPATTVTGIVPQTMTTVNTTDLIPITIPATADDHSVRDATPTPSAIATHIAAPPTTSTDITHPDHHTDRQPTA